MRVEVDVLGCPLSINSSSSSFANVEGGSFEEEKQENCAMDLGGCAGSKGTTLCLNI